MATISSSDPATVRMMGKASSGERAFLASGVALGVALRFYHVGHESMWGDEACMLDLAKLPVSNLLRTLASEDLHNDIAPPLYMVLLRCVVLAFGPTIVVARLFSVVASLCVIPSVFVLASRWLSPRTATYATLLTALSALQVWYAQEARMYALVTLWATLSTLAFVDLIEGRRGAALYVLLAVAGMYTQYYAYLVVLAQLLAAAVTLWMRGERRRLVHVGLAALAIAACVAPWLPVLSSDFRHAQMLDRGFPAHFSPIASIPFVFAKLAVFGNENFVRAYWPLYLVMAPIYAWFLLRGSREEKGGTLLALLFVPLAIVYGGTVAGASLYKSHPFIILSPFFFLLVGRGLARARPYVAWTALGTMLLANLVVMALLNFGGAYRKPRVTEALGFIAARSFPADVVVKVPAKLYDLPFVTDTSWQYYAPSGLRLVELKGRDVPAALARLDAILEGRSRFFLAVSDTQFTMPLKPTLLSRCAKVAPLRESASFPSGIRDFGLSVYLFDAAVGPTAAAGDGHSR